MSEKDYSSRSDLNAKTLLARLERISADSQWAHQASGIRASLAKMISRDDTGGDVFQELLERGYLILEKAAAEYPED